MLRLIKAGQIGRPVFCCRHGFEGVILVSPIDEVCSGHRIVTTVQHHDELVSISIRERPQQDRIHHAEDSGVGSQSKRQGEQSDSSKTRFPSEHPEAKLNISPESVHD